MYMSESSDLKICSIENKNEAKEVGRRETMEKKEEEEETTNKCNDKKFVFLFYRNQS